MSSPNPEVNKTCRRPSIGAGASYLPIKALNTYSVLWKIRARVVDKSQKSTFNRRQGGSGSVFSTILVDAEGTQINCKFWNSAADKYYEQIGKGQVYTLSKGKVAVANKRFSNGVDHNYEISFDQASAEIALVEGDVLEIPATRSVVYASLRSIELSSKKLPFITHVMGVPHSWQALREVQTKGAERTSVRNLTLVDATEYSLEIAFWGASADALTEEALNQRQIICIENVQIREGRDGQGRVGSTLRSSEVKVLSPDDPQGKELWQWYKESGETTQYKSLGNTMPEGAGAGGGAPLETTIAGLYEKMNDGYNTPTLYKVDAYITKVYYEDPRNENVINIVYKACSRCNKKVTEESLVCNSCNETLTAVPRLSLVVTLGDHTAGGLNLRIFHDVAQSMTSMSAAKLEEMIKENKRKEIKYLCEQQLCWQRHSFVVRIRKDTYNNELRTTLTAGSATSIPLNVVGTKAMQKILKLSPKAFDEPHVNKRPFTRREELDGDENVCVDNKRPRISAEYASKQNDHEISANEVTY